MIFTHHPRQPGFEFDPWRTYTQERTYKPTGFWVSVDDEWMNWVRDNWDWPDHPTVDVGIDLSRVLVVDSQEKFLAFSNTITKDDFNNIHWYEVASAYDGIVIAPYQLTHRLSTEHAWYYPWDCASGCIWNLSAVTSVEIARLV